MPWTLINLAVFFLAFGALARLTPCNPGQKAFATRELIDNALWWFAGVLLYGGLADLYIRAGASLVLPGPAAKTAAAAILGGYGPAARLPLVAQAGLMLVAMDVVQYWLHRGFHGRTLWPFHAIHHSAEELDWTTTYRIHPVNFAVYSAGALALIKLIGFSPAAFLVMGPFNLVIGALVHANLNWTFGPLRYVIASPVFHRWHHVKDPKVHDRNFAPTFPVLDLMFGTFYMPKGELPSDYGVEGMPTSFAAQLVWPFQVVAGRLGWPRKAGAAAA
ncbi:MAG TPA: sterol desaturase family protein [Caulobacteraceae bacterium]|nr:sterol desaturase family protein [Caulobacteraceae bacterium]